MEISTDSLSFTDVSKGHWTYDYIKCGDVVLIINRALDCDPDAEFIGANSKNVKTFTDVVKGETTDEYYYNIVAANSHRFCFKDGETNWLELIK